MIKRPVNDKLSLAYEVCFQRDGVSPHVWSRSRDSLDEFGQLYCETNLTDDEWDLYTKLAKGEYFRVNSFSPNTPVFYKSMVGETFELNREIQDRVMDSLGASSATLRDDSELWELVEE